MNQKSPERGQAPPSLAAALRSARADAAERSQSLFDLRGAEIGRLEMLRDALDPVLKQVPEEIDLFDTGIVPGEHPRLFVDMIAFVDMARDRRTYRFHLDTRHGRVILAETEGLQAMTAAVTDYIARRLVDRERALASLAPESVVPPPPIEPKPPAPPKPPRARVEQPVRRQRSLAATAPALKLGFGVLALLALFWVARLYAQGQLPGW